ncbi:hypothetical protein [Paracoccus mutanolyticus]|uniref:hypothetical protein n=1 Tax=Paracoccus mutanolyticus TaxID=1499308 RepID=UPI0016755AE7|nr:hypothetical protein [Paracoccus mutanolyticus]
MFLFENELKSGDGLIKASASQDPYTMAGQALEMGYQALGIRADARSRQLAPLAPLDRTIACRWRPQLGTRTPWRGLRGCSPRP